MHSQCRHSADLKTVSVIQDLLSTWYRVNARDLPWRKEPVKYLHPPNEESIQRVMLQQTRVETVKEYYKRWMKRFPTLSVLANEQDSDEVNRLWQGLGYYSRARNLHKAAQYLHSQDKFPYSIAEWLKVPGVGVYSSGSITSIAWDLPNMAVDGNVLRVISRLFAISADPKTTLARKKIDQIATSLVKDVDSPSQWTQAVMELGAIICIPKPKCNECPVRKKCMGYKIARIKIKNLTDIEDVITDEENCTLCKELPQASVHKSIEEYISNVFPLKSPKKKAREESLVVLILGSIESGGSKMLVNRNPPGKGLFAGMDEFPNTIIDIDKEPSEVDLNEAIADLSKKVSKVRLRPHFKGITEHIFTHIRRTSYVYYALISEPDSLGGKWMEKDKLIMGEYGLKNMRKALGAEVVKTSKRKMGAFSSTTKASQKVIETKILKQQKLTFGSKSGTKAIISTE